MQSCHRGAARVLSMEGLVEESSDPHEQAKGIPAEGPASAQRVAKFCLTIVSIIFINYLSLALCYNV